MNKKVSYTHPYLSRTETSVKGYIRISGGLMRDGMLVMIPGGKSEIGAPTLKNFQTGLHRLARRAIVTVCNCWFGLNRSGAIRMACYIKSTPHSFCIGLSETVNRLKIICWIWAMIWPVPG